MDWCNAYMYMVYIIYAFHRFLTIPGEKKLNFIPTYLRTPLHGPYIMTVWLLMDAWNANECKEQIFISYDNDIVAVSIRV